MGILEDIKAQCQTNQALLEKLEVDFVYLTRAVLQNTRARARRRRIRRRLDWRHRSLKHKRLTYGGGR